MFSIITMFSSFVFALVTVSAVSARAVPRATPPTGWDTAALEVGSPLPSQRSSLIPSLLCSPTTTITAGIWLCNASTSITRTSSPRAAILSWYV
jgi:hypothetical protein